MLSTPYQTQPMAAAQSTSTSLGSTPDIRNSTGEYHKVKVKPGSLGIRIKNTNHGYGLEVVKVSAKSSLHNVVKINDHLIEFEGVNLESEVAGVEMFQDILTRTEDKPERILVLRRSKKMPDPSYNISQEGKRYTKTEHEFSNKVTKSCKESGSLSTSKESNTPPSSSSTYLPPPSPSSKTNETNQKGKKEGNQNPQNVPNPLNQHQRSHSKFECDVCGKEDGYKRLNMQKCSTCGIHVHEECYGLDNEFKGRKYNDWQCWACKAVGKTVKVRKDNEIKQIKIRERPVQCALCVHKSGKHAMHPIYNKSGPDGHPVIDKNDNPIWVHTLCALVSNSLVAACYGCNEFGEYEGSDDDDSSDSDPMADAAVGAGVGEGYYFKYFENGEESLTANPHHYVIASVMDNADKSLLKQLHERRTQLRCNVCNNPDMRSRRIVVQCKFDDICADSCHVGCAKWISNSDVELLHFFPGTTDAQDLPKEATYYCKKHARMKSMPPRKGKKRTPSKRDSDIESSLSKSAHNVDNEKDAIFDSDSDALGDEVEEANLKGKKEREWQSDEKKIKYFENKRRRAEKQVEVVKDLMDAMGKSTSLIEYEKLKEERRKFWEEFGGLTKSEFKKIWLASEKQIKDTEHGLFGKNDGGNQLNKQGSSSSINVRKLRTSIDSNVRGERKRSRVESKKKWSVYIDPDEYDEELMNFEDNDIYFEEKITFSDVERDEKDLIRFSFE